MAHKHNSTVIRIPNGVHAAAKDLSEKRGIPMAEVLRQAMTLLVMDGFK